jgi:hypothetical protein
MILILTPPVQARRDVILSLTSMVKTSLVNFYQKTGFKPHRIIMYRQVLLNSLVSKRSTYVS